MAWINGQWIEDRPVFGGMLGGRRPEEELMAQQSNSNYGRTIYDKGPGAWGLDYPSNRSTGVPTIVGGEGVTPGYNPGLDASIINESMQSSMLSPAPQPRFAAGYSGGLGGIDPWQPVQTPEWQPLPQPPQLLPQPPQLLPQPPQLPPSPPYRPPMPPPPPNIDDVWEPMPPPRPPVAPPEIIRPPIPPRPPVLPPDIIYDPPPVVLPRTDHEFNVAQREKTKARLAQDRAKTKKHYATLRAKGASKQTIAKAKAKSKARSKKIKAQHPKRTTRVMY